MKCLQLLFWGLGSVFLAYEFGGGVAAEKHLSSDSNRGAIVQAANDFKCPFIVGVFADPKDCAHFYVCVYGVPVRSRCGILQHFDVLRRRCLPILVAICGSDKTTTTPSTSTKTGDNFKCPSLTGTYPHSTDCSKYYKCIIYVASQKSCPEKQLFDTEKNSCRPEEEVNCGTRQRPGFLTTEPISTEVTTEISTTTKLRPTGPPDHTCDEDDVDCIITETGDVEDWFICPQDVGSFVHPSSDKLFIFCMNWIPSVKKCGLNLVFSKEASTCIEIA